jgi:hypothetical protein
MNIFFFFFGFGSILLDRWPGDHPQEDLENFGYKLERKVEKKRKRKVEKILNK